MPSVNCKHCECIISYSINDAPPDFCHKCQLTIAWGKYPKNQGVTLFASVGENLGHVVLFDAIKRYYEEQNPNETIIYLTPVETLDIEQHPRWGDANKIFWADISNIRLMPNDKRVYYYRFTSELEALEKRGIYPQWNKKEPIDCINISEPFVVLHARNSRKNPEKNMTPNEFDDILQRACVAPVYVVGNDAPFDNEENVIDLRKQLTLDQIAWLCSRPNCLATVGRDSGVLHLAAAAGSYVIGYGYKSNYFWTPKTAVDRSVAFTFSGEGYNSFIKFLSSYFGGANA